MEIREIVVILLNPVKCFRTNTLSHSYSGIIMRFNLSTKSYMTGTPSVAQLKMLRKKQID